MGLDYRELVPVQEAAGDRGERQIYNLENVVGCLGKKLASSNSSQSWQRVNFYIPRIVVGALLSKNRSSGKNYNNINSNELILSLALAIGRISTRNHFYTFVHLLPEL